MPSRAEVILHLASVQHALDALNKQVTAALACAASCSAGRPTSSSTSSAESCGAGLAPQTTGPTTTTLEALEAHMRLLWEEDPTRRPTVQDMIMHLRRGYCSLGFAGYAHGGGASPPVRSGSPPDSSRSVSCDRTHHPAPYAHTPMPTVCILSGTLATEVARLSGILDRYLDAIPPGVAKSARDSLERMRALLVPYVR